MPFKCGNMQRYGSVFIHRIDCRPSSHKDFDSFQSTQSYSLVQRSIFGLGITNIYCCSTLDQSRNTFRITAKIFLLVHISKKRYLLKAVSWFYSGHIWTYEICNGGRTLCFLQIPFLDSIHRVRGWQSSRHSLPHLDWHLLAGEFGGIGLIHSELHRKEVSAHGYRWCQSKNHVNVIMLGWYWCQQFSKYIKQSLKIFLDHHFIHLTEVDEF